MIGFRVDANEVIATGHLMRCISIALECKKRGQQCIFFMAEDKETERLTKAGFQYYILNSDWKNLDNEISEFQKILENYKLNLLQRYSLNEEQIDEILNQEQAENENIYEIMQLIGRRRGAILGGNIDDERTAKLILDDFRSGKLGKITLEIPE